MTDEKRIRFVSLYDDLWEENYICIIVWWLMRRELDLYHCMMTDEKRIYEWTFVLCNCYQNERKILKWSNQSWNLEIENGSRAIRHATLTSSLLISQHEAAEPSTTSLFSYISIHLLFTNKFILTNYVIYHLYLSKAKLH